MRKLLLLAMFIMCSAPPTYAQDEINKYDIYVGYSHNSIDFQHEFKGFHGVNVSVSRNISRYFGLKADYSFHRARLNDGFFITTYNLHQVVGGVQLKDNSREKRFKPFIHAMAGVAHLRTNGSNVLFGDFSESHSGYAAIVGAGLDVKLTDRIDTRVVQIDYNPTQLARAFQHNVRIGGGIVFR